MERAGQAVGLVPRQQFFQRSHVAGLKPVDAVLAAQQGMTHFDGSAGAEMPHFRAERVAGQGRDCLEPGGVEPCAETVCLSDDARREVKNSHSPVYKKQANKSN